MSNYWNWQVPFYAALTAINYYTHSAVGIFTGFMTVWVILISAITHFNNTAPVRVGPRGETGATGPMGAPGRDGLDYQNGPSLKSML